MAVAAHPPDRAGAPGSVLGLGAARQLVPRATEVTGNDKGRGHWGQGDQPPICLQGLKRTGGGGDRVRAGSLL